jgi:transcriptional regulator with XRE-family HTH domain
MAYDLGISQVAYSKLEKNETKLNIDRLYKIAEILNTKISDLLGLEINKIYQQEFKDNSKNYQEIQNIYQENKEIIEKLLLSKNEQINLLKEQILLLTQKTNRQG